MAALKAMHVVQLNSKGQEKQKKSDDRVGQNVIT